MKKLHVILLAVIGIVSFTAAFGAGFIIKRNKAAAAASAAAETPPPAAAQETRTSSVKPAFAVDSTDTIGEMNMSEGQLKSLIYDLRQKMQDAKSRQKELEQESGRIEITRQTLADEMEQLNQLRENLNQTLSALQEKERSIRETMTEIESVEKANLQRIAATYDKMDTTQSAKIVTAMVTNNQTKDAVKILYYMSERSAGKLLGEIGTTRPEAAGTLSLMLKQIKENP
jgi:flagellar motility protein MotE (MotC chaperone)